jgi:hypothetical protein
LATTIKLTACKLLEHGNILGELAVCLDKATGSVLWLLHKHRQAAQAKMEVRKAKANAKKVAGTAGVVSNLDAIPEEVEEDVDHVEEDNNLAGMDDVPREIPAMDLQAKLEDDAETMEIANL